MLADLRPPSPAPRMCARVCAHTHTRARACTHTGGMEGVQQQPWGGHWLMSSLLGLHIKQQWRPQDAATRGEILISLPTFTPLQAWSSPALPWKKQVVWSRQAPYGDPPLSISGQSVDMTTELPYPVPSLHSHTCVLPGTSSTGCFPGWRSIFTDPVKTLPPKGSRWDITPGILAHDGHWNWQLRSPKPIKGGLSKPRRKGGTHLELFQETQG